MNSSFCNKNSEVTVELKIKFSLILNNNVLLIDSKEDAWNTIMFINNTFSYERDTIMSAQVTAVWIINAPSQHSVCPNTAAPTLSFHRMFLHFAEKTVFPYLKYAWTSIRLFFYIQNHPFLTVILPPLNIFWCERIRF